MILSFWCFLVGKIACIVLTSGGCPYYGVDDGLNCWKELQKKRKSHYFCFILEAELSQVDTVSCTELSLALALLNDVGTFTRQ